jgi:coenzyme F420-dependent glucose-6-phosphate dehydrogenase
LSERGLQPKYGFHPLADFAPPDRVLSESVAAEKAGFDGIFIPDHFHPWSVAQGTPFAWTLIASIAERTKSVPVGTAVTCPTLRYNPAIVAQAFATLGTIYEGRIFLGVGTGEALNEVPVGYSWPRGKERLERLREAVEVIRMLWEGDHVSYKGDYYKLNGAKLYTKPRSKIPIYVSGFGPRATQLAGEIGDGWITGSLPEDYLRNMLIPAYERGLKQAGRSPERSERIVELIFSYDEDYEKALDAAGAIAGAFFPAVSKYGVHDPREIDGYGRLLDRSKIAERIMVIDNPEKLIQRMASLAKLGFSWIEIANLNPDNTKFLELAGAKILPYLREEFRAR